MCGIVGLFAKTSDVEARLGADLAAMLVQLSDRGPDSAGVAFYRDQAPSGSTKLTLYSPDPSEDWGAVARALRDALGGAGEPAVRATHACIVVEADAAEAERWVHDQRPDLRVMSAGRAIEVYKEVGVPRRSPSVSRSTTCAARTPSATRGWRPRAASRRRRRTRSRPGSTSASSTTARSRTTTGCGCALRREGIEFRTDNDTEVAAGYLAWRLREGASLEQALEGCLDDLDGFYTFLVGTADGFAVLRDPIACKPAVLAETDDWVAMASEARHRRPAGRSGRAPVGAEPGVVYAWERIAA